jgi:hypothetical protein
MTKYIITLELEMDPNETVDGVRVNAPSRWNYNALLSAGGYHVNAIVASAYEACCESYVDWVSEDADDRYPATFAPYFHDEPCVHFVAIDEGDEDEELTDADRALLNTIFGNVQDQLGELTVRPTASEVN